MGILYNMWWKMHMKGNISLDFFEIPSGYSPFAPNMHVKILRGVGGFRFVLLCV